MSVSINTLMNLLIKSVLIIFDKCGTKKESAIIFSLQRKFFQAIKKNSQNTFLEKGKFIMFNNFSFMFYNIYTASLKFGK